VQLDQATAHDPSGPAYPTIRTDLDSRDLATDEKAGVGRRAGSRASLVVDRLRAEVVAMPGPGDEMAAGAGRRACLRASHADRERVIDVLKTAFVEGRLAGE